MARGKWVLSGSLGVGVAAVALAIASSRWERWYLNTEMDRARAGIASDDRQYIETVAERLAEQADAAG